ncbi:MAG: MFS transporter [Peptococcaceae bacterium]|nr:MFS transporter [Peptococcaceae bacterium]
MSKTKDRNKGLLNIIFIGLVSFFTDISTEMVYPLIPLYLTAVFGVTPALIGLIEGIAESLASLLKVYSGYISDRFQRKKALAFIGYAMGMVYKLVLIFTMSWVGVLLARVIDRFGKGVRTAPRDVLVSESAAAGKMGSAFGLHKALDMAGMSLGILFAFLLFRNMAESGEGFDYIKVFWLSLVPGVLGLLMFLFIREKRDGSWQGSGRLSRRRSQKGVTAITQEQPPSQEQPIPHRKPVPRLWQSFKTLNKQLKLYLLVVLLFTLGNSSNVFLLLKAQTVGFNAVNVILLYFIYSVTAAVFSMPLGRLSDKIGRKKLLVSGYFVFAIVYLGFAMAFSQGFMVLLFVLYGLYTAMITGVERAYVAEIAPANLKGTMLGLQATVAGLALLPASLITGILWSVYGSVVPFVFGAVLSLAAAVVLLIFMHPARGAGDQP